MNEILLIGMPGGMEWVIILVVLLLLFGGSKLPQLAKALGQSKKAFREGLSEAEEEERLEKSRAAGQLAEPRVSNLSELDDEALFEEARRRAALRRASETNALSDKSADSKR